MNKAPKDTDCGATGTPPVEEFLPPVLMQPVPVPQAVAPPPQREVVYRGFDEGPTVIVFLVALAVSLIGGGFAGYQLAAQDARVEGRRELAKGITPAVVEQIMTPVINQFGIKPKDSDWSDYDHYKLGEMLLFNGFEADAQRHFDKSIAKAEPKDRERRRRDIEDDLKRARERKRK